jgi:nitrite reductase/ring-hydroxylating ferredoxin subunit
VGAWGLGSILSLVPGDNGNQERERLSDQLIRIGVALSVPTAVTGMTDFSTISKSAINTGMAHGLLNTGALLCYSLSMRDRKNGNRHRGTTFSTIGFGLLMASAWLGGKLAYKHRIGVNKLPSPEGPREWKDVMGFDELPDGQARRIEVDGSKVLLYKSENEVMAISAVCSHEEGPLEGGKIEAHQVECPWHQSVFDLRDGRVVHGPSTYPQHRYETRAVNGRLEIRLAE